jgi:hypothetical protein
MSKNILPTLASDDTQVSYGSLKPMLQGLAVAFDHVTILGTDQYYTACGPHAVAAGSGVPALNMLTFFPFYSIYGGVVDRLALNVTTVGGPLSRARIGVYDSNLDTRLPTRLIIESGSFNTVASPGLKVAVIEKSLTPVTLYWVAALFGNNAPTVSLISGGGVLGWSNDATTRYTGVTSPRLYGPLPEEILPESITVTSGIVPWIGLRYSS